MPRPSEVTPENEEGTDMEAQAFEPLMADLESDRVVRNSERRGSSDIPPDIR